MIGDNASKNRLVVLCILDGFGHSDKRDGNAIKQAKTPALDELRSGYQSTLLQCSGLYIGLPKGHKGSSEVSHSVIGLGRVCMQDLPRISQAIKHKVLKVNDVLIDIANNLRNKGKSCHVWGLLSDGGEHSHYKHLYGILDFLKKNEVEAKVHVCLDGCDSQPGSGLYFVNDLQKLYGEEVIATIGGRYYGMDRDNRWDRTAKAYHEMVEPSNFVEDASQYVSRCYSENVSDEFVPPAAVNGYEGIKNGDAFISFNFRTDRTRQMLMAMTTEDIPKMKRKVGPPMFSNVVSMTECSGEFGNKIEVLFPREKVKNSLGEVLSKSGMTQLRAAETEKYAHVTVFFDGGEERIFPGEERLSVESPKISTYDLCPEMSARKLTDAIIDKLDQDLFNVYVINFANADMVAHTGDFEATKKAVECVDECVGRIFSVVKSKGGHMIVTSDHGNAEEMMDEEKHINIFHTTNCVEFILASDEYKDAKLRSDNNLCDVAPTVLDILGIECPEEMIGDSILINKKF